MANGKADRMISGSKAAALMTALLILAQSMTTNAADFQSGLEAYEQGDFATALREWRPLAEQGDILAQFSLGVMYEEGKGVPENDAEAVKWYRKAAEQGLAAAQSSLGFMYSSGEGVPQDYVKAGEWFRRAAEQGDTLAQSTLGLMYAYGKGVPEDNVEGYAWSNIAAAQGDDKAEKIKDQIAESMTREGLTRAQELAQRYWEAYSQV